MDWLRDPDATTERPARAAATVVVAVVVPTLLAYPLREIATAAGLDALYAPGILAVAAYLGLRWALATVVLSVLAFNLAHIEPYGRLAVKGEAGVALVVFAVIALGASALARALAVQRATAERRRQEADLLAGLARLLLSDGTLGSARGEATASGSGPAPHDVLTRGLTDILGVPVHLTEDPPDEGELALPLEDPVGDDRLGALVVPTTIEPAAARRLRRVAPALGALLASARRRARAESERVAHESVRRETSFKTALLRSVSHDLRAPLTGLTAAATAIDGDHLDDEDRHELAGVIGSEAVRLNGMVDALLDAARIDAGAVDPQVEWVAAADVVRAACAEVDGLDVDVDLPELPLVQADPLLLQRALANLLRNAERHAGGRDVRVSGAARGDRVTLTVADAGPGLPAGVRARVDEPFVRGGTGSGSGLGLAIARGFVEAGGGALAIDSDPSGTRVTLDLPAAT